MKDHPGPVSSAARTRSVERLRLAGLLVLASVLIACSGGAEGESSAPIPDGFKEFRSSSKGYSIAYPADWVAQENAMTFGGIGIDAFLAPEQIDGFTPNVNVLCEKVPKGVSTAGYVSQSKQQVITGLQVPIENERSASTGMGPGQLLEYTMTVGNTRVDTTQIIVVQAECGWVVTLTTPLNGRAAYEDILFKMAESLRSR